MTDEEKKAIGQCRLLLNGDITLHIIDDDGGTAYCGIVNKEYNKDLETVLNLIEKQSKEIEELKKPKYLLNAKTGEITTINNSEFISKDKIKAKIEELEKQQKEEPDAYLCIKVLRSLLEKE